MGPPTTTSTDAYSCSNIRSYPEEYPDRYRDYIATNNTSHAEILRMMETELDVNFLPEVIETRPPITNGKDIEKNVLDGLITEEDCGKRIKLELLKVLKANLRLKFCVI